MPSSLRGVSVGLLLWAIATVPAAARTIELTIPEFTSPAGLPFVPWFVGEFAFGLEPHERVVAGVLAGGFGNSMGVVRSDTFVMADQLTVAVFRPGDVHPAIFPLPWRFFFVDGNSTCSPTGGCG